MHCVPIFILILLVLVLPELLHVAFGTIVKLFGLYFAVMALIGVFAVLCLVANESGAMIARDFGQTVADGIFAITGITGAFTLLFLWVDSYQNFRMTTAVFRKLRGMPMTLKGKIL